MRRLGIIAEGQEVIEDIGDDAVRASLVAAGQAAEHYEIARYGTLAAWAQLLGLDGSVSTRLYSPAAVVALRISSIRYGQDFGFESLQCDLLRQHTVARR
jgi:hypothetical protein